MKELGEAMIRRSSGRCIGLSFVQQQRALKLERVKALRQADRVKKILNANLLLPTSLQGMSH